jgi:hypothetical protein
MPVSIPRNPTSNWSGVGIVGLALIASAVKLAIAYNTLGTNDAGFFHGFAKALNQHGLEWTYQHFRLFNHPPLTAYYLRGIYVLTEQEWCRELGIHFPFLFRLPGIVADFLVVLILLRLTRTNPRIPHWALALFALSPVSIMVSGYHGNTDAVMVLFLAWAAAASVWAMPILSGTLLALSCQVKVVPLLFLPALMFFWMTRGKGPRFLIAFAVLTALLWAEPLLNFPVVFVRNVLGYSSYWGTWGISYLLHLTGLQAFSGDELFHLSFAQQMVSLTLKVAIGVFALIISWRRRHLPGTGLMNSIAYIWIVFFALAPGGGAQYLIWLAPFILMLSAPFYACLLVASSIFLFRFYDVISHGLPWFAGNSTAELVRFWAPWTLLPWTVLIIGATVLWRGAGIRSFRFVRSGSLQNDPA